jgi:hypothetical protein
MSGGGLKHRDLLPSAALTQKNADSSVNDGLNVSHANDQRDGVMQ